MNSVADSKVSTYKYRTGASALRCLLEGTLYFALPSQLNDILEAKITMADPVSFSEGFCDAVNEFLKKQGSKHAVSSSVADELNEVTMEENSKFFQGSQRVGIFSTGKRPDNQPMWAYYADDFKGICFELEWTEEILEKCNLIARSVTYSNHQRIHNRADDFKKVFLEVAEEKPGISLKQLVDLSLTYEFRRRYGIESTVRAVSIKHSDWKHEDEIRVISPSSRAYPILREVLKKVFFVKPEFPEFISIAGLIHKHYPNVQLIQVIFSHVEPFVRYVEYEFKTIPITE